MDYVDLIFALAMILVFSGVAWFASSFLTKWKDDAVREGGVSFDHAGNVLRQQEPRAVTWEEFDALRERVKKLEAWSWADQDRDQQMKAAIDILDRKIGPRFCIRWTEEFTSFDTTLEQSFTRNFVWGNNFSMSEQEAWTALEKIKKESKGGFDLVLVTVNGKATLVTSRVHVRCGGQSKHTYFIEEVKI